MNSSASLGSTSRLLMKLLSLSLALCAASYLVGIGAAISRNMIRRGERIANALREAEEQAFVAQARSHVTLQVDPRTRRALHQSRVRGELT